MIISHKYKFIFIKTKKTAGTSIEIALSKYCDDLDIITPISNNDEKIRRDQGYPGPRNYLKTIDSYNLKDWGRLLLKQKKASMFYNHMMAHEVRNLVSTEIWQTYYKFCFERNPWDKIISWYYWINKTDVKPTISRFIQDNIETFAYDPGGCNYYCNNGEMILDRVFMYENINEAMVSLADLLNLPDIPVLPNAKSEFREKKAHYSELLSAKDQKIIADVFRKEIEMFDYEF